MKLSSRGTEILIQIPPHPYRSAAAFTFDYETSAQTMQPSGISRMRASLIRRFRNEDGIRDLCFGYGRGYGNRVGAEIILKKIHSAGIHGTWFGTGHSIIKGNKSGKAYRINQTLEYATAESGFGELEWRARLKSFYHEPFGDYKTHPYYYLGDQAERLKSEGEDIQCHTFSHPYVALEPIENLRTDIEDWQEAAEREGLGAANIFAFPYMGDCYYYSGDSGKIFLPSVHKETDGGRLEELNGETVGILERSGFELFTRCFSKVNEKHGSDFRKYNSSNIYYANNIRLFSYLGNESGFKEFVTSAVKGNSIFDLWLHPNDLLDKKRLAFFYFAADVIADERDKRNIFITTLSDLWNRRKMLSRIKLYAEDNELLLYNDSTEAADDIVMNPVLKGKYIIASEKIRDTGEGRYTFSLGPREKLKIFTKESL